MAKVIKITENDIRRIVSESVRHALNEAEAGETIEWLLKPYEKFKYLASQAGEHLHDKNGIKYVQEELAQMERIINMLKSVQGDQYLFDTVMCGLESTAEVLDFDFEEAVPNHNANEIGWDTPDDEFNERYEEYDYEGQLHQLSSEFYNQLFSDIHTAKSKYKK